MNQSLEQNEPGVELDAITALEYNINGDFLATGDRSGRITVLQIDESDRKKTAETNQENWSPYFQYQSHDPEFDFLKSLEIESKINQIKFCQPVGKNNFLLSTNDKTIKLWKIGEKRKQYSSRAADGWKDNARLELPKVDLESAVTESDVSSLQASTKRTYSNAHTYHINSLALNSDGETYVSADDLRINWWNLNNSETCFNLIDIKPENMEELTEVITAVQFHPQHCHTLVYSSSRGAIKVCDTRASALCTGYAKVYCEPIASGTNKSFISDILNSISDVNFSGDGRYLVSRDYLTVKIWDTAMENRPVKTIVLHDYLRPMLYDLYTNDTIFDKFEVCCSPDGRSIATGSYSNQLKISHQDQRGLKSIDLPRPSPESGASQGTGASTMNISSEIGVGAVADVTHSLSRMRMGSNKSHHSTVQEEVRLEEKVLHCAWHPSSNTVAVAGKAGLCLYKV